MGIHALFVVFNNKLQLNDTPA